MFLRELFSNPNRRITEGGNVEIGGHQAQHLDLKVHQRGFIVPILNNLLHGINRAYHAQFKEELWPAKALSSQQFLSGSSLHFFNTGNIPDDQFVKVKPTVGDIDTMVNIDNRQNLEQFLQSVQGKKVGPATFHGYKLGNEQFSSLWELHNPPVKVQIDFEFVKYDQDEPTQWAKFSHSSAWDDLQAGVKGVFHKYIIQSLAGLSRRNFLERKLVGRGKARAEQDVPATDNMLSFAVSSKEGGGLRQKYEPVLDDAGRPLVKDGLPVMRARPTTGYEQNISTIFSMIAGHRVDPTKAKQLEPKFWSFVGILDIMNAILTPEEKEQVANHFIEKLFAKGAQGLYKGNPDKDAAEKNAAVNKLFQTLKINPPQNLNQLRSDYYSAYKTAQNFSESLEEAEVVQSKRKGIVHLEKMKDIDFLNLLDELRDEATGKFQLQNIPMNVKVDGFGGRFGMDETGRPYAESSRSGPKFQSGMFMAHAKAKGETDPDKLAKTKQFDDWFDQMLEVAKEVGNRLHLKDTKIHVEVLYLPFAEKQPDGRLKFVGIHYDELPKGITMALVPLFAERSSTGEQLPNSEEIINQVKAIKQIGKTMIIDNRLTVNGELDATAIIPPMENLQTLRNMLLSKDKGINDRKREVSAALQKVKDELGQFIINHPNILGKDILGKDYEGIVLNTKQGHVKITSPEQKQVIANKQAAQVAARTEQPRTGSKTAVVAIGSFIGHVGHQELWNYTVNKAKEVGGDPYLFIGNAEGKDDPIPPATKVQTWHKLYPQYAKNISTVIEGGNLMQKVKHELINPLPGKPPRYDNIIIMVGEDRANLPMAQALMKAVNKFQGYEHVRVHLEVTPRGTGMSGTALRNVLKDVNKTPEQQFQVWNNAYNNGKFGAQKLPPEWIHHLMDITRKGMGISKPHTSPSGVRTNMSPKDDDYAINYGPQGLAKPKEPVNIKEANNWIRKMRAEEFMRKQLSEGDIPADLKRMDDPSVVSSIKGGMSIPGISSNKSNGSPYQGYRFGIAMATADGKGTKHTPPAGAIAGDPLLSVFTDEEYEIIKQAAKDVLAGPIKKLSDMKSRETSDTNKTSPVSKPKKNKYGI